MRVFVNLLLFIALALSVAPTQVLAHCQIPCGIYDDHARVKMLLEDVATIRKSVTSMGELVSKSDVQSKNQLVRWVVSKEEHSQKVISTIADYFLTQRVKADQKDYVERLKRHHAVIVAAMKTKQNADVKHVDALEAAVKALEGYYPEHKHE